MPDSAHNCMVALGSNLPSSHGSPLVTVGKALELLCEISSGTFSRSAIYQTPCFPAGAGPDYVNAAALFATQMSEQEVLATLHEIEARFGRARDQRWGQRTLDLDLLAYDDVVFPDHETYYSWRDLPLDDQMRNAPDQLILPHPRMQDRAFVLVPLADVASGWTHPVSGLTVAQMLANLPSVEKDAVKAL